MNDDTNDDEKKPTSKRKKREIENAIKICSTPVTVENLAFIAREFILCTLPYRDPGDVLLWKRTNGNLTLGIKAGVNDKTGKSYGIPYGVIPRLVLVWMVTEIIRTKGRRLELGNRLADFMIKLGLDPSRGGERSDAQRVREQMEKLLHSIMSFNYSLQGDGYGYAEENIQVAPRMVLWWNKKDPDQLSIFGTFESWIEVSEDFFNAVMNSPSPLDIRVLRHIKDSSLGIDLYTILNREAFRAMKDEKPRFLAWEWLHEQTGNEYKRLDNFRQDALVQIQTILAVHPGLLISIQRGYRGQKSGLVISNLSTPSIPPDLLREPIQGEVNGTPPALVLLPPPPPKLPPPEKMLKPGTVARFSALYPNLDPYACKAAFDVWAAGLPPDQRPRHYDRVFLSFAKRWIVGKMVVNNG
jgi:hypothetical protein